VIACAVTFDAGQVRLQVVGIADAKIDAVSGRPYLGVNNLTA
jgi:hypothetical protein